MKSGQFWPCYSQKCKNRKLLRRVTNFFQIFTKLWKFLSYSLFDYRKIVKSWFFGRSIQKPEVFIFYYYFRYKLLLAIWVIFRCFNLFFQFMTMQQLFLKKNGNQIFIATLEPKWSKPEVAVIFYYLWCYFFRSFHFLFHYNHLLFKIRISVTVCQYINYILNTVRCKYFLALMKFFSSIPWFHAIQLIQI